ncbi:hypothetical protein GPJ56_002876 [Histomonas meleagridis]|uniref:uncharacterized protein n=1 Tax=Histomonas meleagridis TaxID=135588 RepID=UPI00355A634B|nr:hypothetical protein GPJ56_002876 [Histomonas meleagridis]KAH0800423.1 hypothetical protein GO595_006834 [Histomonas meleagridis]
MFFFWFSYLIFSLDQTQLYMYYTESDIPEDSFSVPLPQSFLNWSKREGCTSTPSSDGQTLIAPPGTTSTLAYYFSYRVNQFPTGKRYIYVRTTCNAASSNNNEAALCYVDITQSNPRIVYRYGANSNIGTSTIYQLSQPAPNESVSLTIYMMNQDPTRDAVFLLPKVEFFNQIINPQEIPVTSEPITSLCTRYIGHVPYHSNDPKLRLYSLSLQNPHLFPTKFSTPNYAFSNSAGSIAQVPIIANGSHIIGIDLYAFDFMHLWKIEEIEDSNGTKTTHFSMHIEVTNTNGFNISLLVLEQASSSWLDALEKWHLHFSDIYSTQPGGQGLWAAFPQLQSIFPNSTDDRDVYGVQFQWGASWNQVKQYLKSYIYIEPTMIHVSIPYNEETVISDLQNCANDKNNSQYLKCAAILEEGNRNVNGEIVIEAENASWNVGLKSYVILEGKSYDYYIPGLDNSIANYVNNNISFDGIAIDSFSGGYRITYISNDNRVALSDIPYYLYDENAQKSFIPTIVNFLRIYKRYLNVSSGGSGYEVGFVPAADGHLKYSKTTRDNFWKQRFTSGSRPISTLENTPRENSFKYMEEYFSLLLSFGGAASYFSYNAAQKNFWSAECKQEIFDTREHFERWTPVLRAVLNDTVFYANQYEMVEMELPPDQQVPPLDNTTSRETIEMSDKTMFCDKIKNGKQSNCYLVVLLAYNGEYSGSDFRRLAKVKFNAKNNSNSYECFFVSNDMSCKPQGDGEFELEIKGLPKYHQYRVAVIRFKLGESAMNPIGVAVLVVGSVILGVGVVLVAGLCYRRKKENDEFAN